MSIKIVANGKIEVNNVKLILHFLFFWQYTDNDACCTIGSKKSGTSTSLSWLLMW
jgi:hypothetical protein